MQVSARYRNAKISAQKARLVANQVRGISVEKASMLLRFSKKKAASMIKKTVDSVIANAEHNRGADVDELFIFRIFVDEARTSKRLRARARGRGNQILKRSCHITVVVSDQEEK